ncbi:hypothetical protein TNCV_602791 [Trichonephila clavipes]|nr:hypothetical protein TNCV_602791 [Trichonephila clavipes]
MELIAIMCGLSLVNNMRYQSFTEIWILTDSRFSIQQLSNWPSFGDCTSRSILHLYQQPTDWHPIHSTVDPFPCAPARERSNLMTLRRCLPAIMWIWKTAWSLRRLRSTPGLKNKYVEPG